VKLKSVIQLSQLIFLILFALALCFGFSLLFNFWTDYGFFRSIAGLDLKVVSAQIISTLKGD